MAVREIMRVKVEQEHIEKGKKREKEDCPIWLAMVDCFDPTIAFAFCVTPESIKIYSTGVHYVPLPAEAEEFIKKFDAGISVKPFEFTLDDPVLARVIEPKYLKRVRF